MRQDKVPVNGQTGMHGTDPLLIGGDESGRWFSRKTLEERRKKNEERRKKKDGGFHSAW